MKTETFRTKWLAAAVWVAMGAGCAADADRAPVAATRSPALAEKCPFSEVISIERAGQRAQCSSRSVANWGRWLGEPVLTSGDRVYCRFTWKGEYPDDRSVLLAPFDMTTTQVDCPLLGSSALTLDDDVWHEFQSEWHGQSGVVSPLPGGQKPVDVAIVDSAVFPFASSTPERFDHGRAMGKVVEDLACPDGAKGCAVRIGNFLALPYVNDKVIDYAKGGFFGTRGELAAALGRALDAYADRAAKTGARLVINLSVGWSGKLDDNPRFENTDRSLPEDLVYQMLGRASCMGALAVAAAGNGADNDRKGPLLPGGWETLPAPSPAECKRLGYLPRAWPFGAPDIRSAYRPIVYAAGGVDLSDRPLCTTRVGGQPRLVAHGLKVVTGDAQRPVHTAVFSGTSVAAASISGIAAGLWSYKPDLSPHQLMQLIYDKGVELDPGEKSGFAETEFCLPTGVPCNSFPLRRANLCAPLESLLGVALGCPVVGAHRGEGKAPKPVEEPTAEQIGEKAPLVVETTKAAPLEAAPGIEKQTLALSPSTKPFGHDVPWVKPQPGQPVCGSCWLSRSDGYVRGKLDTTLWGWLGIATADLWPRINGWWSWYAPLAIYFPTWPFARSVGDASTSYAASVVVRFYGASGAFDTDEEPISIY